MAFGNGPKIITTGLILSLDAGDKNSYSGTGTVWTDLTGNGYNGSLVSSPTFDSSNGGNITFNGTSSYVTLGSTLAGTVQGTISFWVKLTSDITTGYSGNQRPWGKHVDFECRWGGNSLPADNQKLNIDINGTQNLISVQNVWLSTVWYNIVSTYNSSTNSSVLYVQGVQNSTGTAGNPSALTGTFNVAATTSATGFVNGKMANFLIYNRSLTSGEVLQNYNAQKSRFNLI